MEERPQDVFVFRDLCANHFSRAKAQRQKETLRNAVALCVFAPLRESSIPTTTFHEGLFRHEKLMLELECTQDAQWVTF